MIRKYEGLKKVANKKLALQVSSLALTATLVLGLAGCSNNVEPVTPTPTPSVTLTPQPTPELKDFKLEDATVESFGKDLKAINDMVSKNGFNVRELDVTSFLTYQNIFNIKEEDMSKIIDTYFEGEFDINEISSNADGFASQIITQNILNPVSKHMTMNFNHDELDYLMYQEVEKEYIAVRIAFEDETVDREKCHKAFAEWLTNLEKFYNEDGYIALKNGNKFDGQYYRSTMSEGAEATIEYLGIEMGTWVHTVANKALSAQFDAITGKNNVNTGKIQKALNKITNSENPAEKLEEYLEQDYLTKEEIEELKVVLKLYYAQDLAESILKQCDLTDVQPSILAKGQECEEVTKVKAK